MARPFDLNLLPVLINIYDHRSVSTAAAQLDMSQPAVSGALAKLRKIYGDPLFHRARGERGSMQPTARMRNLIEPLRNSLSCLESTRNAENSFDPATTALTFVLAMSDLGEMAFLPRILRHIHRLAPGAAVRSIAANADHVEHGLETGEIDLAVGYYPNLRNKLFVNQHLLFHHFVCLLRADHPITSIRLSLQQFLSVEHAVVCGTSRTHEIFEHHLKQKGIQRRVALETPHLSSIPFVIPRSDLIVTVPNAAGAFLKRAHVNIRIAHPPLRTPRIDLKIHWHRNFQRDPKNIWLRRLVASLFTNEFDDYAHDISN
jgi:DNA-binding transcriptional LysR family regulator